MSLAGQKPTAQEFDRSNRRIVALGRRTSNKTTTSTTDVLRLDDIPVYGGRSYRVTVNPEVTSTVAGDGVYVRVHYSTDGSTPTNASAILPGATCPTRIHTATNGEGRFIGAIYEPATDLTLSLVVSLNRYAGTGTVSITGVADQDLELVLEDLGYAVGNTGTSV